MREELYKIRPGPIILVCLCLLAALTMVFFGLYALRLMGLNTVDYSLCNGESDYMRLSYCVGELARDHLKNPHWQAVQFVSYILTAMAVTALASRWIRAQQLAVCAAASLMTALIAAMIFKPGFLIALAAFAGGILGVLIVERLFRCKEKK